ncbi:hypothetical protein [Neobacillus citreus]|uniref:Uncharacterized protein n=1 Tax=Neobacillus citreus TaxID=2833578 RepID=A0A9J6MZU0_9BACI|nr:hypothetical protein [Neobacillus citreus]MCH6269108.1 hypothetical protein [Neobacillus citreus]
MSRMDLVFIVSMKDILNLGPHEVGLHQANEGHFEVRAARIWSSSSL